MIHHGQLHKHQNCTVISPHSNHKKGNINPTSWHLSTFWITMPENSCKSDASVKSSKSSLKSLKGTLKRKASKLIKAVLAKKKKKKKAPDRDTLSLSSAEESDNGNCNTNSHDPRQPEVIDIDGDDDNEKSEDGTEEDAEAELGILCSSWSGSRRILTSASTEWLKKDWNAPIYAF